jgi:tetratricopeptide (TPR) repeat protein
MPGSIRDAVLQRVRACSEAAQTVAEMTAVVGNRASYRLLQAVSRLDDRDLLDALEELCADRILNETSESEEVVFTFAHPLVREILYGEVGLARARMLHGVVAGAMEEIYGEDAIDHADELAFHFARTGAKELRAKAVRYLATAGRGALERRADREAVDYLEAALEQASEPTPDEAPTQRELAPLLARAYTHLGRFDDAARLWTAALEGVPPDHMEHASVRRSLGMTHFWRGDHEQAHEHLDAGLASARETGDAAATVRLLVAKAHCLHEVGRGFDALDIVRPALPLAEEIGDARLLARVHRALELLHVWIGPPSLAEEHGKRAIELAVEVGDVSIEFWARWGLAVLAGMRGNTREMGAAIRQINGLADKARSPVLRLWIADMAVELAYARAEWDRGIIEGERAIALARALNQRTLLPRILVWTSQFYVARGDLERAAALVAEAEDISGIGRPDMPHDVHQVVPTYIGKASYLVGLGKYDEAIAAAEKGLEIAEGTGYVLWSLHQCLPVLAEACLRADRVERAGEVGVRMREHSERIDHRLGLAWADACEALVQWKRGDPEGSIPLMRSAADALDDVPMIWPATRLRRQLAARLWEAGRADEAKVELDRVWDVCVRVGAGIEKERARADYRKMGLKAPTEHRSEGPLGLTPEELAIATLVARGLSNPEIAEARGSKVRTVSTHLHNMYKKLDLGGTGARVKLGNAVREIGLDA